MDKQAALAILAKLKAGITIASHLVAIAIVIIQRFVA